MKAVVVETFDQGGSFSQREKDDRRTRFIHRVFRVQCGRHSRDTTAFLPYFSIVAVCSLPRLLDGFLIVSAFNMFNAQKAAVMTEAKDAIYGHAAPSLSQAGARPNSQPPTPGLETTVGDSRCVLLMTSESELIRWETITVWCGPPSEPSALCYLPSSATALDFDPFAICHPYFDQDHLPQ